MATTVLLSTAAGIRAANPVSTEKVSACVITQRGRGETTQSSLQTCSLTQNIIVGLESLGLLQMPAQHWKRQEEVEKFDNHLCNCSNSIRINLFSVKTAKLITGLLAIAPNIFHHFQDTRGKSWRTLHAVQLGSGAENIQFTQIKSFPSTHFKFWGPPQEASEWRWSLGKSNFATDLPDARRKTISADLAAFFKVLPDHFKSPHPNGSPRGFPQDKRKPQRPRT